MWSHYKNHDFDYVNPNQNGRTNGHTDNNIRKCRWKPSVSDLDTWAYKRFVYDTQSQAHGWLGGRTNAWDDNIHQHRCREVAWLHHHAKAYTIPSKRFVSKYAETWKCGERTEGQANKQTHEWVTRVYSCVPSTWYRTKMWSEMNIKEMWKTLFVKLWSWPLTYELEKVIISGQIWEQLFKCFELYS